MNYSEMSDFEINKAVLVALLGGNIQYENMGIAIFDMGNNPPIVVANPPQTGSDFAPCNPWAYGGPIISSHKIDLSFDDSKFGPSKCKASSPVLFAEGRISCLSDNPLRAAMIVYLKMQEFSNE